MPATPAGVFMRDHEAPSRNPDPPGSPGSPGSSGLIILSAFEALIQRGREILNVSGWDGQRFAAFIPGGIQIIKYRTRVLDLIWRNCGGTSPYYRRLQELMTRPDAADHGYHINELVDILESAYMDRRYEEVFNAAPDTLALLGDELIEVAEILANAGCHLHAAQRAGALLQRTLRKLGRACDLEDVELLDPAILNDELMARGVYDGEAHRRIGASVQITHDLHTERRSLIAEDELIDMVRFVSGFLADQRRAS